MVRTAAGRRARILVILGLCVALAGVSVPGGLGGMSSGGTVGATTQKVAVSLGGSGNPCAVTDDGEQWCWGPSWDGGLANGTGGDIFSVNPPSAVPVRSSMGNVASTSGTCALGTGGAVSCWGSAGKVEDGEGSLFSQPLWGSTTPRSYGFAPAQQVAGRCAVTLGGTVQCYGWNNWGQNGNNSPGWPQTGYSNPPPFSSTAVFVSGLSDVVDLTAADGGAYSSYCALTSSGSVRCWGLNRNGQLGNGEWGNTVHACNRDGGCLDARYENTPVTVIDGGIESFDDAVSVHQSCAIRVGGKVSCWGENTGQRFLAGVAASTVLPATELPQFEGAIDLTVTRSSTCAVMANRTVRCQGTGVLGDGVNHSSPASVTVPVPANAVEVEAVGTGTLCVRFTDGAIACWGHNFSGEVGAGFLSTAQAPVLSPRWVIGFGGELPEDLLAVSMTLDPSDVLLELDGTGQPIPQTVTATVRIRNMGSTAVPSVAVDATLATTLIAGESKAITQVGGPEPPQGAIDVQLGDIEGFEVIDVPYQFSVSGPGIYGIKALVRWADPVTAQTQTGLAETAIEVENDDGFEVELVGALTASPSVVEIEAVISNVNDHAVTEIAWSDGGLTLETLNGDGPLEPRSGPTPALPTTLEPDGTVVVRWTFEVVDAGAAVLVLGAQGITPTGGASTYEQLSAEISDGLISSIDLQNEAVAGLEQFLTDLVARYDELSNETVAAAQTETGAFRQEQYDSWRNLGFSDRSARLLAAGNVQQQTFDNYVRGLADGADAAITRLGAEGAQSISNFVDFVTDPAVRRAFAERMVDTAVTEFGYLESGFSNPNLGPLDLRVAYEGWSAVTEEAISSVGLAVAGQQDIWRIEAGEFVADPLAFSTKVGERHGDQAATVGWYTAVGVVEEVATGGLGPLTRTAAIVEGGVDGLRTTSRAATAADAGSDSLGAAARRFAEAEQAAKMSPDFAYGSDLSLSQIEQLGFSSIDAQSINGIVNDVKTRFGVDIEMVFRTAEPYSVGIDGVGKRAFTKEKAVGQMDLLLGAPESLKGRITIFEPKPLPADVLRAAEQANPGFIARYEDRLATQQKNWNAFQAGSARTQEIAEASRQYGGVTVIDATPGNPTYGVKYIEQLDDPVYMATRSDLTAEQITALRNHPSRTRADLEIDMIDGAYTLSDNVRLGQLPDGSWETVKKPVISDYDGQAVRPTGGGEWPAGVRGQVETFVKVEMNKINRSGRHGWSDAANDLPAELFELAAEYVMTTTHPAVAGRVARDLERRFDGLADQFEAKATRLRAGIDGVPDGPLRAKRQAEIDRLDDLAGRYRTFTEVAILALWPPGEKTIVFTSGRVSVGSNQG